jgi:putative flippase GtrA
MRALLGQFLRFGVVGFGGLIVDVVVFNVLRATVLAPDVLHEGPVIAKIISTSLAIIASWLGNRYWTFRTEHRRPAAREAIEFAIVSIGGLGISLGCLWVSHYLLGFTSVLADNIATNVVGLAFGTAFRFTFYRLWVFAPERGRLRAAERPVGPVGGTPLDGVEAVASVEDRPGRND